MTHQFCIVECMSVILYTNFVLVLLELIISPLCVLVCFSKKKIVSKKINSKYIVINVVCLVIISLLNSLTNQQCKDKFCRITILDFFLIMKKVYYWILKQICMNGLVFSKCRNYRGFVRLSINLDIYGSYEYYVIADCICINCNNLRQMYNHVHIQCFFEIKLF